MTLRKAPSTITDDVFNFIVAYKAEHDYAPTLTEISKGVYMARSGVYRHLEKLEQQGRIWRDERIARGIRVLKQDAS
jgi:SOS-response transcriptional repressor LexA